MRRSVLLALYALLPATALAAGTTFNLIDLGPGPSGRPGGWGLSWTVWACVNDNVPTLIPSNIPALTCASLNSFGEVGYSPAAQSPNDIGIPVVYHAFLFRFGGAPTMDLGALGEGADSDALSFNPKGTTVVGYSGLQPTDDPNLQTHAFAWQAGTGMRDLGTFKHGDFSQYESVAAGVNDAQQIVGYSDNQLDTGLITVRAALWEGGQIYELQYQLAGVKVNSVILTQALGISCSGQIAAIGYPAGTPNVMHNYLLIPTRAQPCT
jgi:probable HAF family extracellular repeat protein